MQRPAAYSYSTISVDGAYRFGTNDTLAFSARAGSATLFLPCEEVERRASVCPSEGLSVSTTAVFFLGGEEWSSRSSAGAVHSNCSRVSSPYTYINLSLDRLQNSCHGPLQYVGPGGRRRSVASVQFGSEGPAHQRLLATTRRRK